MSVFTLAANIRRWSTLDVFTYVGNTPGEWRIVQAATLQGLASRTHFSSLLTFHIVKLIIYRKIQLNHNCPEGAIHSSIIHVLFILLPPSSLISRLKAEAGTLQYAGDSSD